MATKQLIYKIITKKHGLTLKTDALKYIQSVVEHTPEQELVETLDFIATSYIQQQDSGRLLVDRASLEGVVESGFRKAAINKALDAGEDTWADGTDGVGGMAGDLDITLDDISTYFHVIDAFEVPKWKWRADAKNFVRVTERPNLLSTAINKTSAYRDRYDLIKQRILRNEAFRTSAFARRDDYFEIMPIKNLQGQKPGSYLLFGMLTQVEEDKYHLEDPDALIELELDDKIETGNGLFTLNSFVLAEGIYTEERTFRVTTLGMPLPEPRAKSLAAFGHNINFFGGPATGEDQLALEAIEINMADVMFVVLSEVYLNEPRVLVKLRELFKGFSSESAIRPLAFIFMGDFSSKPYNTNSESASEYIGGWDALTVMLSTFRELAQNCHFIFIPGPNDPWRAGVLPRQAIAEPFIENISTKLPKAAFASNPCRIKYCSQEVVILRDEITGRMRRNCIIPPRDENVVALEQHLAATLLTQAHLCPLPCVSRPTIWAYDHTLRLYPQPHLLIIAEKGWSYAVEYEGTQLVNPGSFSESGFEFMVYHPATRTCQTSKIG